MKTLLFVLSTVALVSVAVLSTVRVKPVDACASSNSVTTSAPGSVQANFNGGFEYLLYVQSWELTFSPTGLVMDIYPDTTVNIAGPDNVQFDPAAIYVQGRGCSWNGTDDEILVWGVLDEPTEDGNVTAKVTLGAVGYSYSKPVDTSILHY